MRALNGLLITTLHICRTIIKVLGLRERLNCQIARGLLKKVGLEIHPVYLFSTKSSVQIIRSFWKTRSEPDYFIGGNWEVTLHRTEHWIMCPSFSTQEHLLYTYLFLMGITLPI